MYWYLLIIILVRTCADLSFKLSVLHLEFLNFHSFISNVFKLLKNPFIFMGLFLSLLNMCIWSLLLVKFDLSYAYPFTSASYILIILSGKFFFKEHLDGKKIGGIFCIGIGVLLLIIGGSL